MSIKKTIAYNLRIFGLIAICFTIGSFAAEWVGTAIQPDPADAVTKSESAGAGQGENEASAPGSNADKLPNAAKLAP